jgi:dsRNA-specific ribonuclease
VKPTEKLVVNYAWEFDEMTRENLPDQSRTVFAIFGAVYLDGGFDCAKHIFKYWNSRPCLEEAEN